MPFARDGRRRGTTSPARAVMETIEVIMEAISASIRDFLLRELLTGEDRRELTERTPLITGGILDSISTLKLVVFLELQFGITIEAHEAGIQNLDTVEQIAMLVAEKRRVA